MNTEDNSKEDFIMALWDDITKGAKDAASFTVKKTGELTAIAKLKISLRGEETKLSKCFEDIGELYYKENSSGVDGETAMGELVAAADEIKAKISELKAEISKLQGTVICPKCGATLDGDYAFCPKCGEKMAEKEKEEPKEE